MKWRISYSYVNPHPAGPFRGKTIIESEEKPKRGDTIPAMFGRAVITSVSAVKTGVLAQ